MGDDTLEVALEVLNLAGKIVQIAKRENPHECWVSCRVKEGQHVYKNLMELSKRKPPKETDNWQTGQTLEELSDLGLLCLLKNIRNLVLMY